jgi:hypothetical protein
MYSKDSGHKLARRVPVVALAIAALLAVSAWTTSNASNTSGKVGDFLTGVSAVSRTNAWAVGYYYGKNSIPQTLIDHWNGSAWRQVPSADPSPGFNELNAVSALSAKDAWAVGIQKHASGSDCLIERWNGARWTTVTDADHGQLLNCRLDAVTTISANDAWAVGTYLHVIPGHRADALLSLIEHWNGKSWRLVSSLNPGGDSPDSRTGLTGVAATSARNVWAVGAYTSDIRSDAALTLVEHWNGSKWARVRSASPGLPNSASGLNGVAATSASAVAVGDTSLAGPFILQPSHGQWRQAVTPAASKKLNSLAGVAITSGTSAWAVGSYGPRQPWIVHWNGSRWSTVPAPHVAGRVFTLLVAVTAPSADATWAVGTIGHTVLNLKPVTLIEHWTGTKWVTVPSPNPLP